MDNSPWFRWLELGEVDSTNTFLRGYHPTQQTDITLVTAEYQTAGRGQGSNRWEAENGKNLLFSLLVRPTSLPVGQMFVLSEAIALSIREAVEGVAGEAATMPQPARATELTVKWTNDVYVGDRKVAGILIENELKGSRLERCIIGCGINVNQQTFVSDAPNPVSLCQLLGREMERRFVLEAVMAAFTRRYDAILRGDYAAVHDEYLASLYRRAGIHSYRDADGLFQGEIAGVEQSGHLLIRDETGFLRRYAFKEVAFA